MSTTSPGVWERKEILLSDLGIEEDRFKNILFQGSKADSQIFYFDKIKLVKSSFVDTGLCYGNEENEESETKTDIPTEDKKKGRKSKASFINSYLCYLLLMIFLY